MNDRYTLAGYGLCGHIVPKCYREALDEYIENNPGLVAEAEGRIARAGRSLSETMAGAARKLLSGWLQIEELLKSRREGESMTTTDNDYLKLQWHLDMMAAARERWPEMVEEPRIVYARPGSKALDTASRIQGVDNPCLNVV